jgi:hypothetical protein
MLTAVYVHVCSAAMHHLPSGGSSFIAAKVNEAKDMMLGKGKKQGSVF